MHLYFSEKRFVMLVLSVRCICIIIIIIKVCLTHIIIKRHTSVEVISE